MRRGLGKGLGALIPEVELREGEQVQQIACRLIRPNPNQPRRAFDQAKLNELSASIRQHGVVQPVLVRPRGDVYELVAGERRWRAAQQAELQTIPAVVREFSDGETMEIALIENLQREDLNPMEEARAYRTLIEEFGLTQEALAERVGRSRPQISNTLRLLQLEPEVQAAVERGQLSMGHAKVLLGVTDGERQRSVAQRAVALGWSVRALEEVVERSARPERAKPPRRETRPAEGPGNADMDAVVAVLRERLGSPVAVSRQGAKGSIEIRFFGQDDLLRILEMLLRWSDAANR